MTHQLLRNQQNALARLSSTEPKDRSGQVRREQPDDPTGFDATIFCGIKDGPQWIAGRGILDTGCEDNWISLDIIKRGGMVSSMVRGKNENIYTGFGGKNIEPMGTITITWYANKASKTRQTIFLVEEKGPFDILLGRKFIFSENIFMFNQAALVLRAAPITDGKILDYEMLMYRR